MSKGKVKERIVVGYIRVSSQEQVDVGVSLERQEALIRSYAKSKGYSKVEIIADRGISGFKDDRPGFQELRDLCLSGRVQTVIVADLSRLSRSVRSTLAFIEDVLNKGGIDFISLSQNIDTTTPIGKMFLMFSSMMAQFYRDEISYKTKTAIAYKRKNGEKVGRHAQYGFTADQDGRLSINANEQKNISLIKELRRRGHTLQAIANELERLQVPNRVGKVRWYAGTVKSILDRTSENKQAA